MTYEIIRPEIDSRGVVNVVLSRAAKSLVLTLAGSAQVEQIDMTAAALAPQEAVLSGFVREICQQAGCDIGKMHCVQNSARRKPSAH